MSLFPFISLPSGETGADQYARELALLLGVTAPEGSLTAEDLRVWGGALSDANDTLDAAGAEFFAHLSTQLLSAWEFRTGIAVRPHATVDSRRAALKAKRSASGGDIKGRLLAAILVIDPSAQIVTCSAANAAVTGTPRQVFNTLILLASNVLDDAEKMATINAVVVSMKPAYTGVTYAVSRPFFLDSSRMDYVAL